MGFASKFVYSQSLAKLVFARVVVIETGASVEKNEMLSPLALRS